MQAFIVLLILGWLVSLPWTIWLVLLGVVLVVLVVGGYIILRTHDGLPLARRRVAIDPNYVAALEALVAEAETEADALRSEVERLLAASRAWNASSNRSDRAMLHRRVGLAENAPGWLVAAARRAYRAALHPDRHPEWAKEEAERRFKAAENVFDAIAASRI